MENCATFPLPKPTSWDWNVSSHRQRVENLLTTGFLSDIVLVVGKEGKEIKAHSLFLQAGSPELNRKIEDLGPALNREPLIIENVETEPFCLYLMFLYTGQCNAELDLPTWLSLLKIATDFQTNSFGDICARKIKQSLSDDNVISIYQQAMTCGHKGLLTDSIDYICENAWRIVETDAFLELRVECLYELLKQDNLRVRSEIELFNVVMKWAEAECSRTGREPGDWECVRQVLEKVIGLIRFPVMEQTEFTMNVALKNILVTDELVKILLYFTVPLEMRSQIPPGRFMSHPRNYYKGALTTPRNKEKNTQVGIHETPNNYHYHANSDVTPPIRNSSPQSVEGKDGPQPETEESTNAEHTQQKLPVSRGRRNRIEEINFFD